MILDKIILQNFRNYVKEEFNFKKGINIIIGNNAQGKTNLLEGIHYLSNLKSHRSYNDSNLINENFKISKIKAIIKNDTNKNNIVIKIYDNKKEITVDNNNINTIEYNNIINTVIFFPEDLEIVKGYPEIRREYLNNQISNLNKEYKKLLNEFNKILKMRNDWLKRKILGESVDYEYFKIINDYYIKRSAKIYYFKNKYIFKINEKIDDIYYSLSNNKGLKIKYITDIDMSDDLKIIEKSLLEKMIYQEKKEFSVGKTLIGPHRDELLFLLDNINIKEKGSQGQQRMAVLAYKFAELSIFKDVKNKNSILLLDDVFSELDISKNKNLLKLIEKFDQVIITTTDLKKINIDKEKINIIKIKNGKKEN